MIVCRLRGLSQPIPPDAVYIGRGSPWGNPYRIGMDGDRKAVIAKFEAFLLKNPALVERARVAFLGKSKLYCFCAPLPCHGDAWLKVLNDK